MAGNPGHVVNRKRAQRLMAIYSQPNTSKAAAACKVYPYLLVGSRLSGSIRCGVRTSPRLKPALSELKVEDLSRYNRLYNRHMTAEGNQFVALEISKIPTKR